MGHFNNTDNLGVALHIGDHVGYIYGSAGHFRIHSGIVEKLCEKRVWITPDDVFESDIELKEKQRQLYKPNTLPTKYDKMLCVEYGKVVKLYNK